MSLSRLTRIPRRARGTRIGGFGWALDQIWVLRAFAFPLPPSRPREKGVRGGFWGMGVRVVGLGGVTSCFEEEPNPRAPKVPQEPCHWGPVGLCVPRASSWGAVLEDKDVVAAPYCISGRFVVGAVLQQGAAQGSSGRGAGPMEPRHCTRRWHLNKPTEPPQGQASIVNSERRNYWSQRLSDWLLGHGGHTGREFGGGLN